MRRGDEAISALFVFASLHAIGTKQSRRGSLDIRYFPIRPPRPFGIQAFGPCLSFELYHFSLRNPPLKVRGVRGVMNPWSFGF
jgi:hypothetical protein